MREVASLDPKNLNARANLGVSSFFDGRYAEAIPHIRAAMELSPIQRAISRGDPAKPKASGAAF